MRILHVGKFYPPVHGGMETIVENLCQGTAARWDVRVVVAHHRPGTASEQRDGVSVVRVGTYAWAWSVPLSPGLARELWRERVDCVVLHEPNPLAGTLIALHTPSPRLIVWHHSDIVRPAWANATYGPVQRRLYRRADCVIVAAPPLAEHSRVVRQARRVEVIPFGIDLEFFATRDASMSGRVADALGGVPKPRVLFVGRLVYYKGLDVLLDAMVRCDGSLVVAGEGPLEDALRSRTSRLGLEQRAAFLSKLDREELRQLYQTCDVLVLPSTARTEAFGLVQVEAMASGLPVISTNLPSGVPWVNEHGVTGLVVPPGDARALGEALRQLMDDPALRAKMGEAGRRRAAERFSRGQMLQHFVDVVESVVGAAR